MKKSCLMSNLAVTILFMMMHTGAVLAEETATREECQMKVRAATALSQELGITGAFEQINNPKGPFVWKDSYVFALSADKGAIVAHPFLPKLIGKKMMHLKDTNGKMFFAEFTRVGSSPDAEGWVDYMWRKPGETVPSPKHTYVMKVPGHDVLLCAGYYE